MTDYQIINSVNIKINLFSNEEADILIGNYRKNLFDLVKRIERQNVFNTTYHYLGRLPGLGEYIRNLRENRDEKLTFIEAVSNDLTSVQEHILRKNDKKEYMINSKIWKKKMLNFSEYDHIFGFQTNSMVSDVMQIAKKNNPNVILSCIDEGIGSYTSIVLNTSVEIDDIYLYRPEFAIYDIKKYKKIPQINSNKKEIIKILNSIFDYKKMDNLNRKIVFFDQPWRPMPQYLENMGMIKRFFFRKRYLKHLESSKMHVDKMRIFNTLVETCGANNILVKLHPRSNDAVIKAYKKYNCKFLKQSSIPWELFCLNNELKNCIFITVHSSAVGTYDFTVDGNVSEKICIYTYLLGNFTKKNDEIGLFYKKYAQNKRNIYIPKDEQEFIKILKENI